MIRISKNPLRHDPDLKKSAPLTSLVKSISEKCPFRDTNSVHCPGIISEAESCILKAENRIPKAENFIPKQKALFQQLKALLQKPEAFIRKNWDTSAFNCNRVVTVLERTFKLFNLSALLLLQKLRGELKADGFEQSDEFNEKNLMMNNDSNLRVLTWREATPKLYEAASAWIVWVMH